MKNTTGKPRKSGVFVRVAVPHGTNRETGEAVVVDAVRSEQVSVPCFTC
jgi:hypothetical protein